MFGLNKLPKDSGNGIIIGPRGQWGVNVADMKRSRGCHVVE